MEISQEEYFELQRKLNELQKQVDEIPKNRKLNFVDLINEKPIESIKVVDSRNPIEKLEYCSNLYDVWPLLLKLAKVIHAPDYYYVADRCGCNRGYLRTKGERKAPKKIEDLTSEQVKQSVDMLNELIAIYNRYFKEIHKGVYINNLFDKENEFRFVKIKEGQA